jgi:oligopeptide/dipeptide ABC transporter ATP-binding protein
MYAGRVVEEGDTEDVLNDPRHPYTQGLIACIPSVDYESTGRKALLDEIPGTVPPLSELSVGCPFAARCRHATELCLEKMPPVIAVGARHTASCWLLEVDP